MNRLVAAELIRARASRTTWALGIIAPLTCVLWTLMPLMLLPGPPRAESVYGMTQQAYVFALILGILGMTGEYRHQTITWSFLITPRRERVVTAKLAAYGIVALILALVSAAATVAFGSVALATRGLPPMSADVPAVLTGAVLSTTLYGVFGVAFGALVRNQTTAIVVACVWFLYGDAFLTYLIPEVARWLPAGAARALIGMPVQGGALLSWWAGGLLFSAYVAALVTAARLITLRRDVT
ncbi:hypothetical protein ACIBHY_39785 [Nonomuraea sp. NPDC050547]|uniref:hypothetical protein n=1 Tax=Nonomuraea sp. NPDC050547 TaxID=3364368 RepID=UPI0037A0419D